MKRKILFVVAGLAFAAMMTFNFNQSQPEAVVTAAPVNLWGLNSAEAQPESCPCYASNCVCSYKVEACSGGGSRCHGSGSTCGTEGPCRG